MDRVLVHDSTLRRQRAGDGGRAGDPARDRRRGRSSPTPARSGDLLQSPARRLVDRYEMLADVRGRGLMIGIEFGRPYVLEAARPWTVLQAARKGLFAQMVVYRCSTAPDPHPGLRRPSGGDQADPAADHRRAEVDRFVDGFTDVMDDAHARQRPDVGLRQDADHPGPRSLTVPAGWIELAVPDERPMSAYVSRPDSVETAAIVVCHELFAVTGDIRGAADRLAAQGYLVVAPQFYHRWAGPRVELPRDDEGRAAGFGYLYKVTRDTALADMRAVLDHLGDRPAGVLGFSAGGHLAYLAATQLPIRATAVLYGGWLPSTDIPLSQPSPTL